MMDQIHQWMAGRSPRERLLIRIMCALLAVTIIWGGIIRPVRAGLESARNRHEASVARHAAVAAQADAVKRLTANPGPVIDGALADIIREAADEAGFPLGAVTPQGGNGVNIAITSAKPAPLLAWLAELEARGVIVQQLVTTPNGQGTVAAQVTLAARRDR